jgi:hypothetical protein
MPKILVILRSGLVVLGVAAFGTPATAGPVALPQPIPLAVDSSARGLAAQSDSATVTKVDHRRRHYRDRRHWRGDRRYSRRHYRPRRHYRGPSIYFDFAVPSYRYGQPHYAPRRGYRSYGGSSAHVRWCYNRYRSYRAWDNTFQPYYGGRRQCWSPYS